MTIDSFLTSLAKAISYGNLAIVKVLLQSGATLFAPGLIFDNHLSYAAQCANPDILNKLLSELPKYQYKLVNEAIKEVLQHMVDQGDDFFFSNTTSEQ